MFDVKLIESIQDEIYIAFFPKSLRILNLDLDSYITLKSIKNKIEKKKLLNNEEKEIIRLFEKYSNDIQVNKLDITFFNDKLEKLVIALSDKCNMACTYCYEEEFDKKELKSISYETIDNIFNKIPIQFNAISGIQLFGGEPLLELDKIKYICEKIDFLYSQGKLKIKPNIGMISNGTLINEEVIDLIKKYDISLSLSIDGSQKSHDASRRLKNENPSYSIIRENNLLLNEHQVEISGIEATYNKNHIINKETVTDVIKNLREDFNVTNLHISPVINMTSSEYALQLEDYESFVDAVDHMFNEKNFIESVKSTMVRLIEKQRIDYLCGAGITQFSIDTDGSIYPCFMFFNNDKHNLGNVNDASFESKNLLQKKEPYIQNKKSTNQKCKECYISSVCSGCIGANLMTNNDISKNDDLKCIVNCKIFDRILINFAKGKICRESIV